MRALGFGLALLAGAAAGASAMGARPAWAQEPVSAADSSSPDANLFVYRDAARPAGCAAQLYLDGKQFAALPQHAYTSLTVRPGAHELEFRWPSACGHGDVTNRIEIEDRRLYYFALAGDAALTADPLGNSYEMRLHETTSLVPVDPDQGVQTVAACCRFLPARHATF
ncbi:MAG TPA: hypothetical protein VN694_08230 [Caulobacteraceae bacterium]|nr:hypothetical protein [Caulobacteraceae bacterium]